MVSATFAAFGELAPPEHAVSKTAAAAAVINEDRMMNLLLEA